MGTPYKFAILGCPVQHSLSPKMHLYWMDQLNIAGQYDYCATDGTEKHFHERVAYLRHNAYHGCNVTIPHKQHAYAVCDQLSAEAKFTGAVNTLIFKDGQILGENTDIVGFMRNIRTNHAFQVAQKIGQACIIGAGGTTRSVLFGLLQDGFRDIVILNRTLEKAEQLIEQYNERFFDVRLRALLLEALNGCLEQQKPHSLVINTTSIGMSGQGSWDLDFAKLFFVTDIIYTPLITPFLRCAAASGLDYQDGFGMLMYQGAESFRLWTGQKPEVDYHLRQYLLSLKE